MRTFGPPERRECHDCGITRTLEFFTKHDVICDDCDPPLILVKDVLTAGLFNTHVRDHLADVEQDWGGDHIADTNQERTL